MSITTGKWSACSLGNEPGLRLHADRSTSPNRGRTYVAARDVKIAPTPNIAIAEQKEMDASMSRSRFTFLSSLILVLFAAMAGTLPSRGQVAKAAPSVTAEPGAGRDVNGARVGPRCSGSDQ